MSKARILRRKLLYGSSDIIEMTAINSQLVVERKDVPIEKPDLMTERPEDTLAHNLFVLKTDVEQKLDNEYYRLRKRYTRPCNLSIDCLVCDCYITHFYGLIHSRPFCNRTRFLKWETRDEFDYRQNKSIQRYLELEASLVEEFSLLSSGPGGPLSRSVHPSNKED